MRAPFVVREVDGQYMRIIRLPRRVKDDQRGRKRGRVRRRLLKRWYRRLGDRFAAWETYRSLSERDLRDFRAALVLDMRREGAEPRTVRFCTYRIGLIEHVLRERAAGRDFHTDLHQAVSTRRALGPPEIAALRAEVAAGATHDCGEWIDERGLCALCDRCIRYRPDHNGECLNCDEPLSEHLGE